MEKNVNFGVKIGGLNIRSGTNNSPFYYKILYYKIIIM